MCYTLPHKKIYVSTTGTQPNGTHDQNITITYAPFSLFIFITIWGFKGITLFLITL